MNQFTLSDQLKSQLQQFEETVELVDASGTPVGHFVPRVAKQESDECPYSEQELAKMHAEQGGRSLAEIWQSLEDDVGSILMIEVG